MILKDKKILFIAPKFFGYEIEIKKEMENMGAVVDYFDERPKNSTFMKAAIRLNMKKVVAKEIKEHYKKIIDKSKENKYDYVIMIVPETISENNILDIKNNQRNAEFILYMWDSIKNKKNSLNLMKYFDKVYTFDKTDLTISEKIKFRPLFYISDYEKIADKKSFEYDICFIGTAHSDRYQLLKNLEKQSLEKGLKVYYYFYFPSKILFLFRKLFDKNFKMAKYSDFVFKSLSKQEVIDIVAKSKAIIDIQHPKQTGLTMRTIEMLGAKRKLITTNKNIQEYDFYNENNIYIIDRENPKLNISIIENITFNINQEVYKKYSISSWLLDIIEIN
jgi:hypothetical protein